MTRLRRTRLVTLGVVAALAVGGLAAGSAQGGQPGAECGAPNALERPGHSIEAKNSPFNPEGHSGEVYAGSPETASLEHANSELAVSQYDIACVQVSK